MPEYAVGLVLVTTVASLLTLTGVVLCGVLMRDTGGMFRAVGDADRRL